MKIRISLDAREVADADIDQLLELLHRLYPGCRVKRQVDPAKTVIHVMRKMADGGLRRD